MTGHRDHLVFSGACSVPFQKKKKKSYISCWLCYKCRGSVIRSQIQSIYLYRHINPGNITSLFLFYMFCSFYVLIRQVFVSFTFLSICRCTPFPRESGWIKIGDHRAMTFCTPLPIWMDEDCWAMYPLPKNSDWIKITGLS